MPIDVLIVEDNAVFRESLEILLGLDGDIRVVGAVGDARAALAACAAVSPAVALVDMKLHLDPDGIVDADAFEKKALAEIGMPREVVMRHRLPQFGRLFSSDTYSAGYYSYLWSETMDADTWAAFEEAGNPFDRTLADRFRLTLLSTGNETDRAEAYRAFRGRDPDVKALLERRGFPTN